MKFIQSGRGKTLEAIIYPLLIIIIMWSIFLLDREFQLDLYKYGVKPQTNEGLKGILFMPLIHGQRDFSHIINNSIPTFVLLSTLIYFYREIAFYVVLFIWLGGGFLLWYLAVNSHSYHIGMSGVIYGLFGFLFFSGFFKKYLPLQAISLFVAFIYGSMIWGLFPMEQGISWEGHMSGFMVGSLLAVVFRKKGPTAPKYLYEIEKELGIEPPDLEAEWRERRERYEEQLRKERENRLSEKIKKEENDDSTSTSTSNYSIENLNINYEWVPKKKEKRSDSNKKK